ncbi:MAG: hypothetical protein WCA35_15455 [Kovacikia sp.]
MAGSNAPTSPLLLCPNQSGDRHNARERSPTKQLPLPDVLEVQNRQTLHG